MIFIQDKMLGIFSPNFIRKASEPEKVLDYLKVIESNTLGVC